MVAGAAMTVFASDSRARSLHGSPPRHWVVVLAVVSTFATGVFAAQMVASARGGDGSDPHEALALVGHGARVDPRRAGAPPGDPEDRGRGHRRGGRADQGGRRGRRLRRLGVVAGVPRAAALGGAGAGRPDPLSGARRVRSGGPGARIVARGAGFRRARERAAAPARRTPGCDRRADRPAEPAALHAGRSPRRSRARSGRSEIFSVVLLDLDDFKRVNDRFGHDAGDRALREFADVLRSAMRETDVAARLGGEEFACLLPVQRRRGSLRRSPSGSGPISRAARSRFRTAAKSRSPPASALPPTRTARLPRLCCARPTSLSTGRRPKGRTASLRTAVHGEHPALLDRSLSLFVATAATSAYLWAQVLQPQIAQFAAPQPRSLPATPRVAVPAARPQVRQAVAAARGDPERARTPAQQGSAGAHLGAGPRGRVPSSLAAPPANAHAAPHLADPDSGADAPTPAPTPGADSGSAYGADPGPRADPDAGRGPPPRRPRNVSRRHPRRRRRPCPRRLPTPAPTPAPPLMPTPPPTFRHAGVTTQTATRARATTTIHGDGSSADTSADSGTWPRSDASACSVVCRSQRVQAARGCACGARAARSPWIATEHSGGA